MVTELIRFLTYVAQGVGLLTLLGAVAYLVYLGRAHSDET